MWFWFQPPRPISMLGLVGLLVATGLVAARPLDGRWPPPVVRLQLASTAEGSRALLEIPGWRTAMRLGIVADLAFLVIYSTLGGWWCAWAREGYAAWGWTRAAGGVATLGPWLMTAAGGFDFLEDLALLVTLFWGPREWSARMASTFARPKFLSLTAGLVFAVLGSALRLAR